MGSSRSRTSICGSRFRRR
ncbi:hypothetical protein CFP56_042746 [Quercus suber]|uniref:Uncharacterized protein n=1 Tax=Quercus suber TaxID=58331 RepID=A0AAW0IT03_QUESU